MVLDMRKELDKLTDMYKSDSRTTTARVLVYGPPGTGKTHILKTAPGPVFIDSFDPGGSKTLRKEIESGKIFVDARWEKELAAKPTAWKEWSKAFTERVKSGFFDNIGTYCLDSLTTFSSAALNKVLKESGRAASVPQQNDWYPQMVLLENAIQLILTLPCHVIVIAHEDIFKDEVRQRISYKPLVTGKLVTRIPLRFDEIYHADAKSTSKGTAYTLQTQACGTYMARTRLGEGRLSKFIEPDFAAFLKAVDLPYKDKEITNINSAEAEKEKD